MNKIFVGDCVKALKDLPDGSADLVFTSPPYLDARHSAGKWKLDDWVPWMVDVIRECSRVCRGLVAVVCEGRTSQFAYKPAPFLLTAELYRLGFNLRKPPIYQRVGIPGSGGPDFLRNDYEPIICVSRKGKLPWSDPTVMGHPPKHPIGGKMSNRTADGRRINNQLSRTTKLQTRRKPNGVRARDGFYAAPVLANPGNIIRCKVGGGLMGHDLAHENEAPFPLKLAEFFVRSFCPPGGTVLDPFVGSGTVPHAAVLHGRQYIGIELRQEQVAICERRLLSVTHRPEISGNYPAADEKRVAEVKETG